jgi:hypothetical protein
VAAGNGIPKYSEESLPQHQFINSKSHFTTLELNLGLGGKRNQSLIS